MGRASRGCGCAAAVLIVVLGAAGFVSWKFILPRWRQRPPPPSGGELQIHVLDVGPVNGDSILIVSPAGKKVLIDAGDTTKAKTVVDALKRHNVQQLDYFIVTHPHPDHMGGAAEVFKAVKVLNVIDNNQPPSVPPNLVPPKASASAKPQPAKGTKQAARPSYVTKFYDDYKDGLTKSGATYATAQPGTKYDLGGGALLTVLAPLAPPFTRENMRTGGNEANANSIVVRLDYGSFSMLLMGDAEEQTEHRLLSKEVNVEAQLVKIAHHGSKYATSGDFLKRVKPQIAIVSCGEWNRYGHPSQAVLDRLRGANAEIKLYRTDLQGEISITTRGREGDMTVKTSKEANADLWTGRIAQKDDSSRSGFIAYGDFGPPPKKATK
ncbi:MAG TPA: ComEC/Rec2 family competence protein [Pyrinomonadaceae bacterium]